jgi:hypothetical protein
MIENADIEALVSTGINVIWLIGLISRERLEFVPGTVCDGTLDVDTTVGHGIQEVQLPRCNQKSQCRHRLGNLSSDASVGIMLPA